MDAAPPTMRPTREQLLASYGRAVPEVIAPRLRVLFVGINPGLYSGFTGHHFARPGNRFWKALHLAGFTDRVLAPHEERALLERGVGITNVVNRATATADELEPDELVAGGRRVAAQVRRFRPAIVAFLGIGAYRTAFGRSKAAFGEQRERIGVSRVWVLPNPSGLNASYQLPALARAFGTLRDAAAQPRSASSPSRRSARASAARSRGTHTAWM